MNYNISKYNAKQSPIPANGPRHMDNGSRIMNSVRLFLITISLPLLLGVCVENNVKPILEFRKGLGYNMPG